uniref:Uncharacterized protein n=1 Tax=Rhizophora mucronata TaxID=61149 RepID=A0A2P2P842_RHIMU
MFHNSKVPPPFRLRDLEVGIGIFEVQLCHSYGFVCIGSIFLLLFLPTYAVNVVLLGFLILLSCQDRKFSCLSLCYQVSAETFHHL